MAISEYAPGAEVVAGGKVWKSVGLKVLPDRRLEEIHYYACPCGAFQVTPPGENPGACPHCGESHRRAHAGRYVRPEFGFVTSRDGPGNVSTRRPERQYATRIAFANYIHAGDGDFVGRWPGIRVGTPRAARLVSINTGKGQRGFRFCQQCGFADPVATPRRRTGMEHPRPQGGTCRGEISSGVDLGNDFITDVLELRLISPLMRNIGEWWSVAYGLIEGAALALGIRREDLDATVRLAADGGQSVFLFDSVPGGAGHATRIHEHLGLVLRKALERVAVCSCEESTSCYECLRTFSNQRMHTQLNRGAVKRFLQRALQGTPGRAERTEEGKPPEPDALPDALSLIQEPDLASVIRKLVEGGAPVPEVGFELVDEQGRVVAEWEVAWPNLLVGIRSRGSESGTAPEAAGWTTLTAEDVIRSPNTLEILVTKVNVSGRV